MNAPGYLVLYLLVGAVAYGLLWEAGMAVVHAVGGLW